MSEIPASLVKELRDLTGAGMMACKRALEETNGDLEEARRLLRERGLAAAGKRAGEETPEGKVLTHIRNGRGAIVAVGCETEPVSNNEEFLAFAQHLLDVVELEGPEAASNLDEERVELVAKIGENVAVQGAARFDAQNGELLASYVHPPARKIGVLVRFEGTPELARMLAMHIAASAPRYLARADVPEQEVSKERAIYEKMPDVTSKPEQVQPKIVEGMLQKRFFAENVLLDQPWVHDPSQTVGKALGEQGGEVREFVRYALGG